MSKRSNRKFVLWFMLILFTPHISLASVLSDHNSMYVGIQYKPARQHLSKLLIKESAANTVEVFGLKKDLSSDLLTSIRSNTNFSIKYNPHYEDNRLGFSGIFGYYHNKNFRIESEISYETFHIKNKGYQRVDCEKHFALAQQLDISNPNPAEHKYVTLINNGISLTSALINVCYDVDGLKHNIITYSCLGFGADTIDFLSKYTTKFSYQGKLGASYTVSPQVSVFIEGYYHGLFGKKFEKIPVNYPCDYPSLTLPGNKPHVLTTALAMLSIGYYGGSIGIKFIL
ncbi:surface antigen family protein [Ehrlichia chaffeensis str. Liberty]|uniref:P44/Msp2 family outer membrane protein n=1 Tax=Ehrlichia chaffeensis TaxID=945 RepID=UPI000444C779|nr:P44/Msp2 family outer membrane protein [Ehrlichia chaffeensis]AHX05156.1 surface antigen family protein [Ehrlichia chaffeensis str. Jax]AHX06145.1 surface antigen family protein [Ehrlichia chaffeensis str. Liberty]